MSRLPQYARPRRLDEALALLEMLGSGTQVIAGGLELMPVMNHGRLLPTALVDINGLAELRGIRLDGDRLAIGALTVHRDLQQDPLVREHAPLLAEAASQIGGGWQVHNRGTIGGNLVSVHPLYDLLTPLLALEARIGIATRQGPVELTVPELLAGTSHGLGTESLVVRVLVPVAGTTRGRAYAKLKQVAGAYGSANAAAVVELGAERRLARVRLAIGAAQAKPVDVSAALESWGGRAADGAFLADVERAASASIRDALSDQQGDAAWRRAMAGVIARRAVATAIGSLQ
jgi:CO/xanthine dehydrogenase FAD-binding subunit